MRIHIENLKFKTIIGIRDFERDTAQNVILNIKATYTFENETFVDYSLMVELIKKNMLQQQYGLIEHALIGLKEALQKEFPTIEKLSIKISKPDILPSCSVALSQKWKLN